MVKRVIYKGTPLASAAITVAADAMNLTVHADPSIGKKIYLPVDGAKGGLTREQATELARRLVQATSIMDELVIEDDGLATLQDRLAGIRDTSAIVEAELQEEFDIIVHDVASRHGSDVNNQGLDGQLEFLVNQLGSEEVSKILARFEQKKEDQ